MGALSPVLSVQPAYLTGLGWGEWVAEELPRKVESILTCRLTLLARLFPFTWKITHPPKADGVNEPAQRLLVSLQDPVHRQAVLPQAHHGRGGHLVSRLAGEHERQQNLVALHLPSRREGGRGDPVSGCPGTL